MLSASEWCAANARSSGDAREVLLSLASLAGNDYAVRSSIPALTASLGYDWLFGLEVVKIWTSNGDVAEIQPHHPSPLYVFPGYRDYLILGS